MPSWSAALGRLPHPALVLRVLYLAATALILAVQAVPALRRRFLAYGSRATSPAAGKAKAKAMAMTPASSLELLLDRAASWQVPHNFFTHFYLVSVASSLFWAWWLRLWEAGAQLQLVWALMLLQGIRRLLESYAYTSSSKSSMWFAHWILGLVFYLATNIAIWVEEPPVEGTSETSGALGWKAAVLVPGILTAHALQHSYHAYLYQLRTQNSSYQLPSHPMFPNLLCPHYTCEIAIYALLSILAAPRERLLNWTLVCATIFVAANLGVTAIGTKAWYAEKFGHGKVSPRRRMIPWLW